MSFKKSDYYTVVQQACYSVPGFKQAYHQFIHRATIAQHSKSTVINYSRSVAQVALHFGNVPHQISVDDDWPVFESLFQRHSPSKQRDPLH